jgi:hypothetical protein
MRVDSREKQINLAVTLIADLIVVELDKFNGFAACE